MSKNEPVFPVPCGIDLHKDSIDYGLIDSMNGLTKREYFAGLAMQGALASIAGCDETIPRHEDIHLHAKGWIACADALIAALEERKDG